MHPLIKKTFGGISAQFYFRQFMFSILIAVFIYYMSTQGGDKAIQPGMVLFIIISTFLYPYARFVYESVMSFILGKNVFYVNAMLMLIVKFITMIMCWMFSVFIAPIGLAYLYYHHSKIKVQ